MAALTLLDLSAELANAQNWQGAYAGLDIGYRWGDLDLRAPGFSFVPSDDQTTDGTLTSPARSESYKANGIIGGVHVGYNFLIQPSWLVGIEADVMAASADETASASFLSTDGVTALRTSKARLGLQATIRGRAGYVTGPWHVYATGGVAFARVTWSEVIVLTPPPPSIVPAANLSAKETDTRTGWTIGGGAEYAVNSNLSVRWQYLYEDFGSLTVPIAATSQTGTLSITAHKLTFGGSYRY